MPSPFFFKLNLVHIMNYFARKDIFQVIEAVS